MKKHTSIKLLLATILLLSLSMFAFTACKKHDVHSFTEKNVSEAYLRSSATCTEKAKYYYSCECGEKGKTTFEVGEPLGHTADKICNRCGILNKGEAFYNNLIASLAKTDGTFSLSDFDVQFGNVDLKISVPGVYVAIDENNKVTLFGEFSTAQKNTGAYGSEEKKKTFFYLENDKLYAKEISEDVYEKYGSEITNVYAVKDIAKLFEAEKLDSDFAGESSFGYSSAIVAFETLSEKVFPVLEGGISKFLGSNSSAFNAFSERIFSGLFEASATDGGFSFKISFEKLNALNDALYKTKLEELVDTLFGKGTYASIPEKVLESLRYDHRRNNKQNKNGSRLYRQTACRPCRRSRKSIPPVSGFKNPYRAYRRRISERQRIHRQNPLRSSLFFRIGRGRFRQFALLRSRSE